MNELEQTMRNDDELHNLALRIMNQMVTPDELSAYYQLQDIVAAREKASRLKTLEESCPLVCGHCRDGDRAQFDNLNGVYVHGERRGACFANGIRVLLDKERRS